MGSEFKNYKIKAMTRKDVWAVYENLVQIAVDEFDGEGYSGTIKECSGLTILNIELNEDDAITYIEENAKKWGDTLAIKIIDKVDHWMLGGWYSC